MHLTLVLPSLLALPRDALGACTALHAMAQRAPTPRLIAGGIDAALLAAAQLPTATPIAPLAARGAGLAPDGHLIARADPIALIAGRDDVLLGGRVDDLAAADADAFIAMLNRHFADDGLVFVAPRPDAWFVRLPPEAFPEPTPLPQVQGAIHAHLPRGPHAGQWKRWLSEMQMLLHEDARNVARERAGQQPVNGIWIADAGNSSAAATATDGRWYAPAGRAGDVARGLAAQGPDSVTVAPAALAELPDADRVVVVLAAPLAAGDLDGMAAHWITPALEARDHGRLAALDIIADDGGAAFAWTPAPASWWTRLRMRNRTGTFTAPSAPDPA